MLRYYLRPWLYLHDHRVIYFIPQANIKKKNKVWYTEAYQ